MWRQALQSIEDLSLQSRAPSKEWEAACEQFRKEPYWSGLLPYQPKPLGPLIIPVGTAFFTMLALRLICFYVLLPPVVKYAIGKSKSKTMKRKFEESAWRTLLYGFMAVFCVSTILFNEENIKWVRDTNYLWQDFTFVEQSQNGIFEIYCLYFALYLHELLFVFIDTAGDDFTAMVIHHIVTLALLIFSYLADLTRVGALITILHDTSDFFLAFAKCFNYAKDTHPKAGIAADLLFVCFTVSFYFLRLYVYPLYPLRSAIFGEACRHIICTDGEFALHKCWATGCLAVFIPLLVGLQCLQVFWGFKLAQAVYRKVVLGKLEDHREKDD